MRVEDFRDVIECFLRIDFKDAARKVRLIASRYNSIQCRQLEDLADIIEMTDGELKRSIVIHKMGTPNLRKERGKHEKHK